MFIRKMMALAHRCSSPPPHPQIGFQDAPPTNKRDMSVAAATTSVVASTFDLTPVNLPSASPTREPPSPTHPRIGSILNEPISILGILVPTGIIITLFVLLSLYYRRRQRRTTQHDVEWDEHKDRKGDSLRDRDSLKTLVQCCTCVLCEVRSGKGSTAEGPGGSLRSTASSSPTSIKSFQWPAGTAGRASKRYGYAQAATSTSTAPRSPSLARSQSQSDRRRPRSRPRTANSDDSLRSTAASDAAATDAPEKKSVLPLLLPLPPRARTRSEPAKAGHSLHVSFATAALDRPGMF